MKNWPGEEREQGRKMGELSTPVVEERVSR